MYRKIEISGIINIETGLHIGGSTAFAAIGAIDSPVTKDTLSGLSLIPGSSLKGKMRSLLFRSQGKLGGKTHNDDGKEICRLFGSGGKDSVRSRLIFSDSIMMNEKELKDLGLYATTEVKFENTINRLTGVANPRQIERTIRGAKFPLSIIYDMDSKSSEQEIMEDFQLIAHGLNLLQYDYLGGHGSRGYGKIKFSDIKLEVVVGSMEDSELSKYNELFSKFTKEV